MGFEMPTPEQLKQVQEENMSEEQAKQTQEREATLEAGRNFAQKEALKSEEAIALEMIEKGKFVEGDVVNIDSKKHGLSFALVYFGKVENDELVYYTFQTDKGTLSLGESIKLKEIRHIERAKNAKGEFYPNTAKENF